MFPDPGLNFALEHYGEKSMCFLHHSSWSLHHCDKSEDLAHWGSGCYKVRQPGNIGGNLEKHFTISSQAKIREFDKNASNHGI